MKWAARWRLSFSMKLFVSHLAAVFLVSGSVGTFFYVRAMDNMMRSLKSRLQNSAALLSQSIDARDLEAIRAPEDMALPAYADSLDKLRRVRRTNPDIAFLYVMRRDDDAVRFVLDSDETDAQAMPGREYEKAVAGMLRGFHEASVDDALVEDEWGVFLSGYAPLRHGDGRYMVGIDMRADEVKSQLSELRLTGMASLFAAILLALLFALYQSRGLTHRIKTLSGQCQEIAFGHYNVRIEGRTYDEFDDLASAFNTMSERLSSAWIDREKAMAELQEARDQLEARVAERTRALRETMERMNVLRGLLPICSACKKIRNDRGYWQQVEEFVSERTEASFTHGICPECSARLYAEFLDEPCPGEGDSKSEEGRGRV